MEKITQVITVILRLRFAARVKVVEALLHYIVIHVPRQGFIWGGDARFWNLLPLLKIFTFEHYHITPYRD